VRQGLGVAVIDEFSVADPLIPGLVRRPLKEPATITPYAIHKRGRQLSSFTELAIRHFQQELATIALRPLGDPPSLT